MDESEWIQSKIERPETLTNHSLAEAQLPSAVPIRQEDRASSAASISSRDSGLSDNARVYILEWLLILFVLENQDCARDITADLHSTTVHLSCLNDQHVQAHFPINAEVPSQPTSIGSRNAFHTTKPRLNHNHEICQRFFPTSSFSLARKCFSTSSSRSLDLRPVQHNELITKQRPSRPVSPNLSIYSWKIMIGGALHRNTGMLLSAPLYLFGASYLIMPFIRFPFGAVELIKWFGGLPGFVKLGVKWVYGFAFSFHFAHGLRHLIWDTGAMLTNKQVEYTVYAALAFGVVGATWLCLL